MTNIPAANNIAGVAGTTNAQRQESKKHDTRTNRNAQRSRDLDRLRDEQQNTVEDTLKANQPGIRDQYTRDRKRQKSSPDQEQADETFESVADEDVVDLAGMDTPPHGNPPPSQASIQQTADGDCPSTAQTKHTENSGKGIDLEA